MSAASVSATSLEDEKSTGYFQSSAVAAAVLPDVSADLTPANQALLTTLINAKTPVGTAPNVVYSATGASIPSAVSGELNALVLTAPTNNSNVSVPGGYVLDYVTGGNATLQGNPFSVLVGAATTGTLSFSGGDTAIGGNGFNTFDSSEYQNTSNHIYGGTGQNLFNLTGGDIVSSQGTDTIIGGTSTINATGSVLAFNSYLTQFTSSGSSTLVGFSGTLSLTGSASALVFDNNATLVHVGGGESTIIGAQGGLGGTTIDGGSGATLYFGTALLTYVGGTAVDTLVGSASNGPTAATVGAAGALIFGAGSDNIQALSGSLTYIGFNRAAITLGGAAANLIALPNGDVDASQSSGSNTIFDNGTVSVLGGSGATAIVAGSGNSTLNPGTGNTLILVGDLNSTQRTLTIGNFNGAHDFISLLGYAPNADASAFQSETFAATPAGTNTTVTLLDGTHIVFQNAQNLAPFSFT